MGYSLCGENEKDHCRQVLNDQNTYRKRGVTRGRFPPFLHGLDNKYSTGEGQRKCNQYQGGHVQAQRGDQQVKQV